jgi:hypothetical protein
MPGCPNTRSVTDIDAPLGFLSTEMTDLGFFDFTTLEPSSALLVTFTYSPDDLSTMFDV